MKPADLTIRDLVDFLTGGAEPHVSDKGDQPLYVRWRGELVRISHIRLEGPALSRFARIVLEPEGGGGG